MPDDRGRPTAVEVRNARLRLGLSQSAFAKILGVKRQGTISDWESGAVAPSLTLAVMEERLLDHFGPAPRGHAIDPRSYALGVLAAIERDAATITAKVAEARRVLGATTSVSATESALQEVDAQIGAHSARQRKRNGDA
jgi:DNA-binding XRE family transcriptional regulator